MPEHSLSRTTHTLDMAQIAEIDERLTSPRAPSVTPLDLDLDVAGLAPSAVLTNVWWEGSPEFPYIYGDFSGVTDAGATPVHVQLHTPSLIRLSQLLGLHHRWGV
jgi:hypothetical protein